MWNPWRCAFLISCVSEGMTRDYGLDSHSWEQEETERCRGVFGMQMPLSQRWVLHLAPCAGCTCTQAVWSTCSTAGWTCFSPDPSISSELST